MAYDSDTQVPIIVQIQRAFYGVDAPRGFIAESGRKKSKKAKFVIPAMEAAPACFKPGESSRFNEVNVFWTPVFTGVTTFYKTISQGRSGRVL